MTKNNQRRNYYQLHKEKELMYGRTYKQQNRERLLLMGRNYYEEHKKEASERHKKYRKYNRHKLDAYNKKYKTEHKTELNEKDRIRRNHKYKNDVIYRLRIKLRTRLNQAIRKKSKAGSAVKDLGCSIESFKKYIESKFSPGMTWDNYGRNGWHLDHIIPLIKFDLGDRTQFLIACHYTNYQPMWQLENIVKRDFSLFDFREGLF